MLPGLGGSRVVAAGPARPRPPAAEQAPPQAQHTSYLTLLRALTDDDWARETLCPGWTVHDVATHVLADHAGRLTAWRDGHDTAGPEPGESFPSFIHRINDQWVRATRRLSPRLLIDLTAELGQQIIEFWQTTDPNTTGWPVSWAITPDTAAHRTHIRANPSLAHAALTIVSIIR